MVICRKQYLKPNGVLKHIFEKYGKQLWYAQVNATLTSAYHLKAQRSYRCATEHRHGAGNNATQQMLSGCIGK